MKHYERYKPSGVEWIGEIPAHWDILSIRRITQSHKQGYYTTEEYSYDGIKLIRITDIDDNSNISLNDCPRVSISQKEYEDFALIPNDLVFARSGTIGRFGVYRRGDEKVIFASYLIRFRFINKIITNYLKFYFLSNIFKDSLIQDLHGGANKNIHAENIKDRIICLPSVAEQTVIARFLNHKTIKIDDLIAKKQRVIDLLGEEKAAIINHAVTKGLNADAPMKDSGIPWFGQIPRHWKVGPVKRFLDSFDHIRVPLSSEERGRMTSRDYDYYGASGIIDKVESYIFEGDYILLGEDGANLLTRSTALAFKASGKFWVNNHAHILRPKVGNLDYYVSLMETIDYTIWISGSAQPKLTAENLGGISILTPPADEQDAIASFINDESVRIADVVSTIGKQIDLLQEYRTALISEAVTGKIDVRGAN
jgi:type I restriction enzyme S subunit